ncbi:MAG: acylphosphatase [Methanothrix sp.]|nr:acylphosphatase [Methanothrix sp.]
MMKSVELIIKGEKVNNVGYRPFLLLNALTHEIEKLYAFNAIAGGQEAVILRAEGEDEHIASYIEFVKSSYPPHAKVGSIEVKDFNGHVGDAYKYAQILQLEQMYKAIPAIISIDNKQDAMLEKQDIMIEKQDATISILKEVREDTSAMLEKQDAMLEKQDAMLEKQDATISILEEVREDTSAMLEKQDATISILEEVREDTSAMLEKQDATISILEEVREDTSAIKADISCLRKDASESLYEKYEQLCQEIAEIKATLSEIKARAA